MAVDFVITDLIWERLIGFSKWRWEAWASAYVSGGYLMFANWFNIALSVFPAMVDPIRAKLGRKKEEVWGCGVLDTNLSKNKVWLKVSENIQLLNESDFYDKTKSSYTESNSWSLSMYVGLCSLTLTHTQRHTCSDTQSVSGLWNSVTLKRPC